MDVYARQARVTIGSVELAIGQYCVNGKIMDPLWTQTMWLYLFLVPRFLNYIPKIFCFPNFLTNDNRYINTVLTFLILLETITLDSREPKEESLH